MPELPEVEIIKNDLNAKIKGRKILGILYCDWPKIISGLSKEKFDKNIKGRIIKKISRRAKNIIIELSGGDYLLFHMKMTGHLLVQSTKFKVQNGRWAGERLPKELKDPKNQFIHLSILLSGALQLAMSDLRKFGWVRLMNKEKLERYLSEYGPEPLDINFTKKQLADILGAKRGPIKKILMDQKIIAGIGNIYSDEILFAAGIAPLRPAYKIKKSEILVLYKSIKKILRKAIELRGTSSEDFRDASGRSGNYASALRVYQREGEKCTRCQNPIKRIKFASRSAHWCPKCQK